MKAALIISERDNVATALEPLEPGRQLDLHLASGPVVVIDDIPAGHKVALRRIDAGEPVLKYGSPIGVASAAIPAGAHVHTHNVSSSRGRGDLAEAPPAEPRLAEPPDGTMTAGAPDASVPDEPASGAAAAR